MIKRKDRKRFYRIVSFFLLINIIGDLVFPTCAFALTGGPSQPEFESFEPAATNQMVDLFSGDFNYNIPLISIPGPNGGYPVNLAYHAGATMEQQASWVGLGWNINPGVINRNMRGLPDDFNGDQVFKEYNLKPRKNFELNATPVPGEKWCGIPFVSPIASFGISYDNYKGFGVAGSVSGNFISANFNTQDGLGLEITPSILSYQDISIGLEVGLNSREGMSSFGVPVTSKMDMLKYMGVSGTDRNVTAGLGFAGRSVVPTNTFPMNTNLTLFDIKAGSENVGLFSYYDVNGSVSNTTIVKNTNYAGYGYCYMQNNPRTLAPGYLLDFNRDGDYPVTKEVEALPVPMITHDVFSASGEGISGSFRVHRSDVGILSDPQITSTTNGNLFGLELGLGAGVHGAVSVPYLINQTDYSGRWSDQYGQIHGTTDIDFNGGLDEPFSLKFEGELNTDDGAERSTVNLQVGAEALDMHLVWDGLKKMFVPGILNSFNNGNSAYSGNPQYRSARRKRDKLIEYRTRAELAANLNGIANHVVITPPNGDYYQYENNLNQYSYSSNPSVSGWGGPISHAGSHFGELSIVKADGFRYQYGIPVYQTTQEDVVFSVNATSTLGGANFFYGQPYGNESAYNTNVNPGSFDQVSASVNNIESKTDQFYQSNSLPPYASNFLLTAVYSPDYVDLTGNGPSIDDMGYYVKYNYQKTNDAYNWRTPYAGVFLSKGDYSNVLDDKESYFYGTKETWYLNSIETKTHIATFITSNRLDGYDAPSEYSGAINNTGLGSHTLQKLDKINLYSIQDMSTAIQTVNFSYDYSLCPNIPNNINHTSSDPTKTGKLTLKKVWFSYLGNNKGQLSPYEFQYQDANTTLAGTATSNYATSITPNTATVNPIGDSYFQNPVYSANNNDRWGNYKVPSFLESGNTPSWMLCGIDDYPYVDQDLDYNHDGVLDLNSNGVFDETSNDNRQRNYHASAWCLRQITLPSGGQINIDYEQDDYAYIQNQPAGEMFQIVSTGNVNDGNTFGGFSQEINTDHGQTRLYFTLKRDTLGNLIDDISRYIPPPQPDGSQHIYFKTFVQLKSDLSFSYMARDYVEGYFDIVGFGKVQVNGNTNFYGSGFSGTQELGWVEVSQVPISNNGTTCHPISKASWQHLKLHRSDLLDPNTNILPPGLAWISIAMNFFMDAEQLILGFYHSCKINAYASKLELSGHGKPSFMRLSDPNGHKKGGGHRVRRITYSDNWNNMATTDNTAADTYGQEYSYLLGDGRSSGVAAYEPLQGGEENPFKQPSKTYSPINGPVPFKSRDLYIEKPYGEKYYPSPMVGYSRVIVKNLDRTIMSAGTTQIANQKSLSGISVTEFYTAKDFPVQITYTSVNPSNQTTFAPPDIPIPLIGSLSWDNRGYTQGYEIMLNNMHGQLKSQATYAPAYFSKTVLGYNLNSPSAAPQAMVQYIYNTLAPYTANADNYLNNKVNVLTSDGSYTSNLIGQSGEEFVDMKENFSKKDFSWLTLNFDFNYLPPAEVFFCMMPWPTVNYTEKMYRSVVHNKIIHQSGILSEVKTTKDGSTIDMKNILYDATTGEALLTTVTNNFDKPVYTYNKQAYWAYNSMGPAYQNYRYSYNVSAINAAGIFTVNNSIAANFNVGDVVEMGSSLTHYWVTNKVVNSSNISNTDITLIAENGTPCSVTGYLTIIKSGFTNQQDLKMGHIVSLKNPMISAGFSSSFSNAMLQFFSSNTTSPYFNFTYLNCSLDRTKVNATITYDASNNVQEISLEGLCDNQYGVITFNPSVAPSFFQQALSVNLVNPSQVVFTNNVSGATYSGLLTHNGVALTQIPACLECNAIADSVLQVSAMHYTDQWNFNYNDAGISSFSNQVISGNPYRCGSAGIWRPLNNWAYIDARSQTPPASNPANLTQINRDGTFALYQHNWTFNEHLYSPLNPNFASSNSIVNNNKWTFVSEITNYNPFGYVSEKVDALGIYSSVLYGYTNCVKTAEASNSSYFETAFEGFEDHGNSGTYSGTHGHIAFSGVSSGSTLSSAEYHTGYYSLPLSTGNVSLTVPNIQTNAYTQSGNYNSLNSFSPIMNGQYQLSFWLKRYSNTGIISVSATPALVGAGLTLGPVIDGWQKVDYTFMAPSTTGTSFVLQINAGNTAQSFIDDIRIQPFTSAMKTYVYDPVKLWLLSELDNRNYATFYNYDEEGQVVQVKKETEKGIVTVKTSRSNIRRNLNQ